MMTTASRTPNRAAPAGGRGILCGTDFSERADHAVRAAAAIAKRIGEPLILAHAIEMPHLGASRAKMLKWLTASRRKDLLKEAARLRKSGVEVEDRIPAGRADEVLVDLAEKEAPRLLVVSSLGRRGAGRWLLGSVAGRAAERSATPTLVVRDSRPLVAWACGERPLKVFVCFNFTLSSEAALRWVKDLTAIGPCEVVVGYVDWPSEHWSRLGAGGPLPFAGNTPEIQAVLERDVKARAGEMLDGIPFRPRVEAIQGPLDVRLAEMAKEEEADLVVVGSHQYQGFERLWHASVSRGLLHGAAMGVAVVPLATARSRGTRLAPPVRRVLVTTDFSAPANTAIPHAYSILQGGGKVHLLHVVAEPPELPGGVSNAPEAARVRACAAKLRALIPAEATAQGIRTQVEVVKHRDTAEGICQTAERLGVDVVCLGTHGRSGWSKALMGSVAQQVIARSRRPLLVVRSPVE